MSVGSDQINHQWCIIRHKNSFTFFKKFAKKSSGASFLVGALSKRNTPLITVFPGIMELMVDQWPVPSRKGATVTFQREAHKPYRCWAAHVGVYACDLPMRFVCFLVYVACGSTGCALNQELRSNDLKFFVNIGVDSSRRHSRGSARSFDTF